MKERLLLKSKTIPVIPNHVRFEFNEVRKEWVLLAPERALYPDPIAIDVLKKCDGKISIQLIGEDLAKKYKEENWLGIIAACVHPESYEIIIKELKKRSKLLELFRFHQFHLKKVQYRFAHQTNK